MRILLLSISIVFLGVSSGYAYQVLFTPGARIGAAYTDNVDLTNENEISDTITSVTGLFDLDLLGKTKGIKISFNPEFRNYERETHENGVFYNASFYGWADLSRNTKVELNNKFLSSDDPVSEEDTSVRPDRSKYYQNTSSVRVTNNFGASNSVYLDYEYSFLENDNSDIENSRSLSPSMGISYKFFEHWQMTSNAKYVNGEFDISDEYEPSDGFDNVKADITLSRFINPHVSGVIWYSHEIMNYKGTTENYQIYDPAVGLNYQAGDDVTISVRIGYLIQDNEESEDEEGISLVGNVQKRFSLPRLTVDISGETGYDESYFNAENLGFEKFYEAGFSAEYRLSRLISLSLSGDARYDDYINLASDRKDMKFKTACGIVWQLSRVASLDVSYSFSQMNSNIDENDYMENRVSAFIKFTPSMPLKFN